MARKIDQLYKEHKYLEAYKKHTDMRVEKDPHEAVGGAWESKGKLQFDFLKRRGLMPDDCLLDIGCGTLRGGRFFIDYLDTGNYCGIDISEKAIAFGKELVANQNMDHKKPYLEVINGQLDFSELSGMSFDFVLAQSVFTHLLPEDIECCFSNLTRVMNNGASFFFTFNIRHEQLSKTVELECGALKQDNKNFYYPDGFFERIAEKYGFKYRDWSYDYHNKPYVQRMMEIWKK